MPTDTTGGAPTPNLFKPIDTTPDGVLNTSTGPGDVLSWGDDDAVLMRIAVDGGPRALAIDALNNVWIGGYGLNMGYYNGATGDLIKNIPVGKPCYGALIDGDGTLWVSNQATGFLARIDHPSGAHTLSFISAIDGWVYGIGIDQAGYIYTSSYVNNRLRKYDPVANSWVWSVLIPGGGQGRGVAVDLDGNVWVVHSATGKATKHNPANGAVIATVTIGSVPTGVAVDAAGKIWVTNFGSNNIMRIDTVTNSVDFTQGGHLGPYNYSDMTGIIARTITTQTGTWIVLHDSGIPGALWGTVCWNEESEGDEPPGTSITVEVRSSEDGLLWSTWASAVTCVMLETTPPGQFLEVKATLRIVQGDVSPVLSDLIVKPAVIEVAIDIKPTSCPNPLRISDKGVIPVAILGTVDFDVNQIDPDSVKLAGVSLLRSSVEDVSTPFEGVLDSPYSCTKQGPDGFLDLTLKFDAQEVVNALDALIPLVDGQVVIVELTGMFKPEFGDIAIIGKDIIIVRAKGSKAAPQSVETGVAANFPNPFNPETWIPFKLSTGVDVDITIYSSSGREVRFLDLGFKNPGSYMNRSGAAYWDGKNNTGETVTSGIYFYRFSAGEFSAVRKMVVKK